MKILIIGYGSIAKKHVNAIKFIDKNTIIYALRSENINTIDDKVINIYNINEININEIDFIIISNPTALHFETIKNCLQYSKPLFIEKPLFSLISKQTQELVDSIKKLKIKTYVACNLRFLSCLEEIKIALRGERINEVNVYCGSFLPDWRPNQNFRKIYSANKDQGGGVHIDLIHELDYVYWIFGEPKKSHSYFKNNSSLNISSYDYANYLWEYDEFTANITLNYYRRDSKRTLEVITDKSTYLVNLLNNSVTKNDNEIFKSDQKIIDTYIPQMKYFMGVISMKKESVNTIVEANRILELCIQE